MKFEENISQLSDEELENVNGGLGVKFGFIKCNQSCQTDEDAKIIYGILNQAISTKMINPDKFTNVLGAKTSTDLVNALMATGYITSVTESEAELLLKNIGCLELPSAL